MIAQRAEDYYIKSNGETMTQLLEITQIGFPMLTSKTTGFKLGNASTKTIASNTKKFQDLKDTKKGTFFDQCFPSNMALGVGRDLLL